VTPTIPGAPTATVGGVDRRWRVSHRPNASRPGYELVHRVVALDVTGRVGLGIPEGLRIGEDRRVRAPVPGHRAQDEVGRAVDDAAHPRDVVGGQVRRQRAEDRYAAGHGRLEPERRAGPSGDGLEIRTVMRHDVLVGGHDRLGGTERRSDQRPRGFVAAHQLDDDIGVGRRDQVRGRVRQEVRRDSIAPRAFEISTRDAGQDKRRPVGMRRSPPQARDLLTHSPGASTATRSGTRLIGRPPAATSVSSDGHRANGGDRIRGPPSSHSPSRHW
jgi:hypothetical protein